MLESFFGLQKRPFLAVPSLDRYCPVPCQESAFQMSQRAIGRGEGPVAILGGTGMGKSMVCLRIGEAFRRSFEVVLLASSQICSRRALLQCLLFELRMPYRDLNEGELRLSLLDRLQPSNDNPSDGLVLIVDEAQSLSPKLLDELRMITNLTRDGVPRVRLVLCGTLRLEEMLGHPQLESLNQRIAVRCYLTPLSSTETLQYLTHKIERCGAAIQSVMTDEAMRLIHRATDGVPRLIDQLADQALRTAAEACQRPISAALVEQAWASLQQLPLPWSDEGKPIETPMTSTIEFGALDAEHDSDIDSEFPNKASESPISVEGIAQTPIAETTFPSSLRDESANLLLDRPLFSPIPSAGMGLSQFALLPILTPKQESNDQANEVWESFVEPSEQRFQQGPIEDYAEDFFSQFREPRAESADFPSSINYDLDSPIAMAHESEPAVSFFDEFRPEEKLDSNESHSFHDELFGSGFDEEVPVEVQQAEEPFELQEEIFAAESNIPSETDVIDRLVFEIDSMAPPCDTPFRSDTIDPSLAELHESLSALNLEAMTIDLQDTIRESLIDITTDDELPFTIDESPREDRLSTATRGSILSFADSKEGSDAFIVDDRDMLIIEEDVPNQFEGSSDTTTPVNVHPYKQLFSKLRG